jgi:hypothetical protein
MAHVRHFTGGSRGSTPVSQTNDHEVVKRGALQFGRGRDVRFGSLADMCAAKRHIRFSRKSGHFFEQ